jgi:hypothetical protein
MGRVGQIVVGFVVLALAFSILSVPPTAAAALAAVVTAALGRAKERWAIAMVAGSTVLCIAVLEVALRLAGSSLIYYREHEMFGQGDHYLPHADLRGFRQPFGDLVAMSQANLPTITDPRTVDFVTDSLGNRNDHDYAGESLVLIGDSFGVANGTTQEETLAARLSRELGQRVYNASYPGDPQDYLRWRRRFEQQIGESAKAAKTIFLFYEGNDLPCPSDDFSDGFTYLDAPPRRIRELATYRFFFGLGRRLIPRLSAAMGASSISISIARIGEKDVGFLNTYLNATRQTTECDWDNLIYSYRPFARSTALIAMAPEKYRVYHSLLNQDPDPQLPNVRWRFIERLGQEIGTPTLDLTPSLVEESKRLLPEGKYTYWRDDIHWNGLGISAAAKAIAAALKENRNCPGCAP